MMQCPNCQHEGPQEAFGDPARCPECGVYYAKALAHQQRMERAKHVAATPPTPARTTTIADKLKRGFSGAAAAMAEGRKARQAGHLYCTSCGATTSGKSHTRGSMLVEIVLWLCFLLPGLIYSAWRLSTREQVCSVCDAPGLIPVNSPRARRELGRE
jgi:ssDNA-binding Zn-finger/Zn-ribbon topoisomerase 1